MKWDALEREIYILSRDFASASKTLAALAAELQRERQFGSLGIMRAVTPLEDPKNPKKAGPSASQADLF